MVGVDAEQNVLLVRGAVPGPTNGLVLRQEAEGRDDEREDLRESTAPRRAPPLCRTSCSASRCNEHLLWLSVKRHLGNQRQGTAKVKTRGEVSGGGRKPWRQKGTGRARSGSNTSPLWPGGGRAFGPKPRDYRTELPQAAAPRGARLRRCRSRPARTR